MIVGIPRSLFFYHDGALWINFLKNLNIDYVISPKTNKEIVELGNKYANDEMCLSVKNYLGHVAYLQDKCDVILIPRIANYGTMNQTCTNFLAMYDVVNNLFDIDIIDYNIDLNNKETLKDGLVSIGMNLGKTKKESLKAYRSAVIKYNKKMKEMIINNINNLKSTKKKVLFVSHNYNTYDEFIGKPIINLLKKLNVEIIYSDLFNKKQANEISSSFSNDLYWKYSKDEIGTIKLAKEKIDGVLFLSSFPCGLDSLVNELVIRKINIPYLNIVIDDLDSMSGVETRIESFVDILNQ